MGVLIVQFLVHGNVQKRCMLGEPAFFHVPHPHPLSLSPSPTPPPPQKKKGKEKKKEKRDFELRNMLLTHDEDVW